MKQAGPVDIELRELNFVRDDLEAGKGISLTIKAGSVVALMGDDQSGAAEVLTAVNRTSELHGHSLLGGRVLVGGVDVAEMKAPHLRRIAGYISSMPILFPGSVADNVAIGLRMQGVRGVVLSAAVESALRRVGLWDELRKSSIPASVLRLGQQQRLCLARALALGPRALLLEQPTRHLRPSDAADLERVLTSLAGECTIVFSVREPSRAARIAEKVAFLQKGELIEAGSAERLFTNPLRPETQFYLGRRT